MLKKLRPEHLRYLVVAVNLLLTGLMAYCGLFAFGLNLVLGEKWRRSVKEFALVENVAAEYSIPDASRTTAVTTQPSRISNLLEPPPPPALLESPKEEEKAEEGVEEKGPLTEKWDIGSAYIAPDPAGSIVWLAEKKPQSPVRGTFTTPRRTYGPGSPQSATPSAQRYQPRTAGQRYVLLEIGRPAKIDGASYVLCEVRETPRAIVYQVEGNEKRYLLTSEEKSPFDGTIAPDEEEEGAAGAAGALASKLARGGAAPNPDEAGGIVHGNETLGEKPEAKAPVSDASAGPPGTGKRRSMTRAESEKLSEALSKMPESERRKVRKALAPGGGSQ